MTVLQPILPPCSLFAGDTELPLTAVKVTGRVDGSGVVFVVEQTFGNPLTEPTEAVYTFPLPYDGAVNGMTMHIGDRVVAAVIKERGAAEAEYKTAVAQGHTAGLVTQERAEIFTTHVGNIHPGESIKVTITVHAQVAIDGSEATLRFPTMIKERYSDASLPDVGAVTPPRVDGPIAVDTNVTITFVEPVAGLVCDTFKAAEIRGNTVTITSETALRSDIVLRWDAPRTATTAKWTPDAADSNDGTIEVTIRREAENSTRPKRRAVSVVLDRSGSMSNHYLEWARRIVEAVIAMLNNDDLVHVMTFDSVVEAFGATEHGFTAADRATCARIVQELQGVTARGGTELGLAIEATGALLATLPDDDREHIVLLLSDGAVGDEATAMNYRRHELSGARVITVAIGENANGFMSALAADGTCIFVEADHQVAQSAAKVVSRLATPAHRHARLVAEGLTEQAPHIAPDIYPDLVVRLTGRMARPAPGARVEVVSDEGVIAVASIEVSADSSITTRWASSRIKALDADVMAASDAETVPALEKQIADLSIKHQVLSKYTAWIAVDRSRTTDTVVVRTIHQPYYGLFFDDPASLQNHAFLSPMTRQSTPSSFGATWLKLWSAPRPRRAEWVVNFDAPTDDAPALDDVDSDIFKRPAADLDLPIGMVVARLYGLVNDASSTVDEMESVLKVIEFFLLGAAPSGLMKRVGVTRLKRLMAKCATALRKGDLDTARTVLRRIADYLNEAEPESIF
jgi:Ca-activated chloride channel family protein